jgi:nickel superoxide dismutase
MAVVIVGRYERVGAHCQVPCGIYDDAARIARLLEDQTTIAKAVRQINDLADKKDTQSLNQINRWVATKEQHASHIIEVVSEYFLTQKVKDVAPDDTGYKAYLEKLAVHHRVMRAAMKTKQTADPANADKLKVAIEALGKLYVK